MNEYKDRMVEKLENEFSSPNELNKRQISIFLKPEILSKLDKITEDIKEKSNNKITRNYLIELAIDNLIECAPIALKDYEKKFKTEEEPTFDTVIFPCDITGVDTFKMTKSWFYVRTDASKIDKLKYIGLYTGSPVQAITHYGEIDRYESKTFNGQVKYIYFLKGDPIELENPVKLGSVNPQSTRSPKYTTLEKLKKAKYFSDLTL